MATGQSRGLTQVFLFAAAVTLAAAHAIAPAAAAPVAMVTDVEGKATFQGDTKRRDVTILAEIEPGAQLQLEAGATVVALYLDSGDEYAFKGPALVNFKAGQPEVVKGAPPQKRGSALGKSGKHIRIKPVGMAQGAMVMRSFRAGARIRLLSLAGTKTLETQPEFRWQEVQTGIKYQFEISDDTGRMLHEAQLGSASLKLPSSVQLKEGVPYTWEVSARLPDGRKYSSLGDFSIAAPDLRAQAEALRPAPSTPLSARVTYAAWLEQMELKDEARRYWKALAAERPGDAQLQARAAQ